MLGKLRKPEHKVAGHLMSAAGDMNAKSAVGIMNASMLGFNSPSVSKQARISNLGSGPSHN